MGGAMMLRTPTKATTRGQGCRRNVVLQASGGQWEQMRHEYAHQSGTAQLAGRQRIHPPNWTQPTPLPLFTDL